MTNVANFSIEYIQFINAEGKVVRDLPAFAKDSAELIKCYRMMILVRTFDAKAVALQRTGKLGTFAATTGQEAVSVALGSAMHKDDVLCPAYREYGAQLQRGVKMSDILAYWGGDERGNAFGGNNFDFPIAVPIGSQTLHAVGVSYAFKLRKEPRVAVSVCGDGATSQGDFYEAMNLAGDWQLPVIFVVNNNQWAISIPRFEQTHAQTLAQKAIAAGFNGIQVDGNDVIALRYAFDEALAKARRGEGPTLIEAITYRLCDHTTADDASRYRSKEECDNAWKIEPIARLREYLIQQKFWSEQQDIELQKECSQQVEDAVKEYQTKTPEPVTAMFDYLYAELPEALLNQRETAIAFATKGDEHHG